MAGDLEHAGGTAGKRLNELLELLPHREPLRLIDEVTEYVAGSSITAAFHASSFRRFCDDPLIPPSLLIEGLAQTAVLFTQLETSPLQDGEFPLLGSLKANINDTVSWDEPLRYTVKAVRLLSKQAVLEGEVRLQDGRQAVTAVVTVAVAEGN